MYTPWADASTIAYDTFLKSASFSAGLYSEEDPEREGDGCLPFTTDGYGGWGGHAYHGTEPGVEQDPVVFVHGNTADASDFDTHADYLMAEGYGGDELWAITFAETGSSHDAMCEQLDAFVDQVLDYTGADAVDIVAHSLGVTGARYWMEETDSYDAVDDFVGLAGANHGSGVCDYVKRSDMFVPFVDLDQFVPDFISRASARSGPLNELNSPEETPGDVAYYTVRGTADVFFPVDSMSPRLEGAEENVTLRGASHAAVRDSRQTKELLAEWLD